MIIPIRCFSCGKVRTPTSPLTLLPFPPLFTIFIYVLTPSVQVVGDLWEQYLEKIDNGMNDV